MEPKLFIMYIYIYISIDLGFYETSFVYTFPANTTVIQEKASIEFNTIKMGGLVKIIQRWKLADSTNASKDKITLLEDQIKLTTFRILVHYGKKVAIDAHSTFIENITQHFLKLDPILMSDQDRISP